MSAFVPFRPKIYHIVHIDRLASIVEHGRLFSDSTVISGDFAGTTIGMQEVKEGRLARQLESYPGLMVGDCVPFNFCPRSVMLYVIAQANSPKLLYRGGEEPIAHLQADLFATVEWADRRGVPWVFTSGNAASGFFTEYVDLSDLAKLDWQAIRARYWSDVRDEKQAEFLIADSLPWKLVEKIGCRSRRAMNWVRQQLLQSQHRPDILMRPSWYYQPDSKEAR